MRSRVVLALRERDRRILIPALFVIALAAGASAPHAAQALFEIVWNHIAAAVLGGIASILHWISELLIKILEMLVGVFMGFARYNDFGSNRAVSIGWPIVRDVVNMFFIVILLLSAFATIIGYEKSFHYREVLPKLLLMAVLINFSKTLILLLVDFSQVVTLTFVNAFTAAGPGNFVRAFRLGEFYNLSDQVADVDVVEQIALYKAIILNLIFAIILTSISIMVMAALCIFFLVRIIVLWIAIIMSPAALFATAIPGRLQEKMKSLTGDYWSRLGSALSGGPIAAFFIWLSLALVQQSGDGANNSLTNTLQTAPPSDLNRQVLTSVIGNAEKFSSFIVAIAFMLMALDAAMKAGTSLGSAFTKLVSAGRGAVTGAAGLSLGAARLGVSVGAGAAALGVKGARAVGGYAAGKAEERFGVREALGRRILASRMGAAIAGGVGARMIAAGRKGREEREKRITAGAEALTPEERAARARTIGGVIGRAAERRGGVTAKLFGLKPEERAAQAKLMMMDVSGKEEQKYVRERTRSHDEDLERQGVADPAERRRRASVMAQGDSLKRKQQILEDARTTVGVTATPELKGQIDEQLFAVADQINKLEEQNPLLATQANRENIIKRAKQDATIQAGMDKTAKNHGLVVSEFLGDALKKDANGNIASYDAIKMRNSINKLQDPTLKENAEAFATLLEGNGGKLSKDKLEAMQFMKEAGKVVMRDAEAKPVLSDRQQTVITTVNNQFNAARVQQAATDHALSKTQSLAVRDATLANVLGDVFSKMEGDADAMDALTADIADKLGKVSKAAAENAVSGNTALYNTNISRMFSATQQIQGRGYDDQVKMLAGMLPNFDAALLNFNALNTANKDATVRALENLTNLEKVVHDKRTRGESLSANEKLISDKVAVLRQKPPTVRAGDRDRVTAPVAKALGIEGGTTA